MKKIIAVSVILSFFFYVLNGQEEEKLRIEDLPGIDNYFRLVWKVHNPNNSGAPLLIDSFVISSFGIDSALLINSGKKSAFPINISNDKNIIAFENWDKIIVKNISSNKILLYVNRTAGYFTAREPQIINSSRIIYQKDYHKIISYDLNSNKILWEYKSEELNNNSFPHNENIVCLFDNKGIKLLDYKTGVLLWTKDIGNTRAISHLSGSNIYVLTEDNGLFCIDINKMKIKWKFTDFIGSLRQDIIIDQDRLYFVSNWKLYSIDFEGNLLWSSKEENYFDCISIVNDLIIAFLSYAEPVIVGINKYTGVPEYFSSKTNDNIFNSIMYYSTPKKNKVLSAPSYFNNVYCFEILK